MSQFVFFVSKDYSLFAQKNFFIERKFVTIYIFNNNNYLLQFPQYIIFLLIIFE
jgi:hypothetical protein